MPSENSWFDGDNYGTKVPVGIGAGGVTIG